MLSNRFLNVDRSEYTALFELSISFFSSSSSSLLLLDELLLSLSLESSDDDAEDFFSEGITAL